MVSSFLRWLRSLDSVDATVPHPVVGTLLGMATVALLVPILSLWHGANGPLGQSIPLFFLAPVLLTAAIAGRGPGVVVACAAIAVWDWFFIPPLYRVTISSLRDVLALPVFLAVALLTGQLAMVARRRTREALRRADTSEALYELSAVLIGRHELSEILVVLVTRLRETFNLEACAVVLPDGGTRWHAVAEAGTLPLDLRVEENRDAAATAAWVSRHGQRCVLRERDGERTPPRKRVRLQMAEARAQFLPLRVGSNSMGVLQLVYRRGEPQDAERDRLLDTLANGVAIALEQERLSNEERAAALARASDQLKSALLSSVSHDLRTPLAGIKAAASTLLQDDIQWTDVDRRAFLCDIDSEADRLTRLVSNLLDLSRIEAGAIKPDKEWEDIGELMARVVERSKSRTDSHPFTVRIAENVPAIRLDAVQIEQALTNLVENAQKYSSPGTSITVAADVSADTSGRGELRISVFDRGQGIAASEQETIFEAFYRVAGTANVKAGSGMGLAIVKGLVEAHGGRVEVQSEPKAGSTFTMILPLDAHVQESRAHLERGEATRLPLP